MSTPNINTNTSDAAACASCTDIFANCDAPCTHNSWDNARVKNGRVTLNCRMCPGRWKLPHPIAIMCPEFHESDGKCPLGVSCPYLHIYRYKRLDMSPTNPEHIGAERDELLHRAASIVLNRLDDVVFPTTVLEEIQTELKTLQQQAEEEKKLKAEAEELRRRLRESASFSHSPYGARVTPEDRRPSFSASLDDEPLRVDVVSDSEDLSSSFAGPTLDSPYEMSSSSTRWAGQEAFPSVPAAASSLLPLTERFVPMQRTLWEARRKMSV